MRDVLPHPRVDDLQASARRARLHKGEVPMSCNVDSGANVISRTPTRKPFRKVGCSLALLAAAPVAVAAMAAPASATTTAGQCTVTPNKPAFAGFDSGGHMLMK